MQPTEKLRNSRLVAGGARRVYPLVVPMPGRSPLHWCAVWLEVLADGRADPVTLRPAIDGFGSLRKEANRDTISIGEWRFSPTGFYPQCSLSKC